MRAKGCRMQGNEREVLVTGAAGFVGSEVVRGYAGKGVLVRGIGFGEPENLPGLTSYWNGNISAKALATHGGKPDIIIHCASGASVAASIADPDRDFINSVGCMQEVLNFQHQHCPEARLVFASSAAVYGVGRGTALVESDPSQPLSPYGLHKQICEEILRFHGRTYGFKIAIVRLFSVYGEGLSKQLPWDACGKLLRGEWEFSGTGDEIRDWLHVQDAANLLRLAAGHASPQVPICNGATSEGVSVREVLVQLGKALGVTGSPVFNGQERKGDPKRLIGSTACARTWGWQSHIGWREGMQRYAAWYKNAKQFA